MLQADEGTEARELRDLAADEIAHFVERFDVRPWIGAKLFHTERDALVRTIDFEHGGFDDIALLHDFARMVDLAGPRHVGHVDHAGQCPLPVRRTRRSW